MKKSKNHTDTLKNKVNQIDADKKVNPLDLSSDQDLSVALMNLISIEEHFIFSGAKTQKSGFYDLINTVHDIRTELMARIITSSVPDSPVWNISIKLLAASMRLMEVGTKSLSTGKQSDAYDLFNRAYDLYSVFWGINMGLIDLSGIQEIVPDIYNATVSKTDNIASENTSKTKNIWNWIKRR